jgi:hypothetical protein
MSEKEINLLSSDTEIAKTIYSLPPMTINFTIIITLVGIFVSNNINEYFIRNLFIFSLCLQLFSIFRFFYISVGCLVETMKSLDKLRRDISYINLNHPDKHIYTEKVLNLFYDFIQDGFQYYKKTYDALMFIMMSNCLLICIVTDLVIQMRKIPTHLGDFNAIGLLIMIALMFYTLPNNINTFLTCISVKLSYKSNVNRATEIIWNDSIKNTNFQ